MSGPTSWPIAFPIIRCTIRGIPRLAAGPAQNPWSMDRTNARVGGRVRPRPSAGCIRWTAASFELPARGAMEASGPMKISAKAEYACMALLALAQQSPDAPPVRIREISDTHAIPERYLVQILLQLKGAGLVLSTRGASGGYRLARPAGSISLGEVISAVDGPETATRLPHGTERPMAAVLASVWDRVQAAERAVLDRTMIADLAAQCLAPEWTI